MVHVGSVVTVDSDAGVGRNGEHALGSQLAIFSELLTLHTKEPPEQRALLLAR